MGGTHEYLDTWLKAQRDAFGAMTDLAGKLQQSLLGFGGSGGAMPGAGGFPDLWSSWTQSVAGAFRGAPDAGLLQETLARTLRGSNAYTKMYELWMPLLKAIQEKGARPEAFRDLADPARCKEVLDRVFGFDPGAASRIAEEARKLVELYGSAAQGFMKPWQEATGKSLAVVPQLAEGHPESLLTIFHNLFGAFDGTVGRIFHVPAVGKDREKVELLLRSLDVLSVYQAKNTEYEHLMYLTGTVAFEKLIAALAEKVNQGEEIRGFNEFFELWVTVNERAYSELFRTEGYAKLQSELLEASLNVRKHSFKLAELYLYDLPIALRSEMDDLYKTVYELKKKVKRLERKLGEVKA